jgi:DNA-binding NtrC family response regulator
MADRVWRTEPHEPIGRLPTPVPLSALVGSSAAMVRLRAAIVKVATSDRPVLVQGPTGSGKELVALALHSMGPNPNAPLVDVNCGAVPESLMEGQLFGWERGAFTGAERQQDGLLAAAGEGTLFLDEIGDLILPLQAKLLRVLETRCFRPLGITGDRRFSGRIVSATNVDLHDHVQTGRFRDDLYHRLSVLVLRVPSLDERREDIRELVDHFARQQQRTLFFTDDAIELLSAAPWPGNVRQLRNAIDQLAVFADDCAIRRETIQEILAEVVAPAPTADEATSLQSLARLVLATQAPCKLKAMEAALVDEALAQAGGNRSQAARLLGVERKVVERRLAARLAKGRPSGDG